MSARTTVAEALAWGRAQLAETHPADAEYLLRTYTGWDRAFILTNPDALVDPGAADLFAMAVGRRQQHEPLQYIIGIQEFWGLSFRVTPAVLIPRPETEHVIEAALARLPRDLEILVADIGTGSGAIAVALAIELPLARVIATDLSADALLVAQQNIGAHGLTGRVTLKECDLLPPDARKFDCIVSNPPYIDAAERGSLAAEVRDFEPAMALFAPGKGLGIYRRLVPLAQLSLRPGGWLIMEIGYGQADSILSMLSAWQEVSILHDLQGIARVISARLP